MLVLLFNWVWVALSAFLWGLAAMDLFGLVSGCRKREFDVILMAGLCFLTVFAQFFSLFGGVGMFASCILLLVDLIILIFDRKEIISLGKGWLHRPDAKRILLLIVVFTYLFLLLSSGPTYHYDTDLYHAQSIHWIEDYGIVPGLGNLHNRLAYNSSFFCLQALFSWKFLLGRSLHGMNGFVCLFLLTYAICSLKVFQTRKFYASDFLRLSVFLFLSYNENLWVLSSPGSDFLSLGLVLYIFVKWVSYLEDRQGDMAPYAFLCVLAVFAVSVKLSSAMLVLLTLMPAIVLVRRHKWKEICFYLGTGILVIAPFLIRNVILSGYLIYPYPELDLFSFDWKMPAYTLFYDRNEIKVWGWGLNDINLFATPIKEWFPVWMDKLDKPTAFFFSLNILCIVIGLCKGLYQGIFKKDGNYLLVVVAMASCFLLWFIGSPLPRYGIVFTVMLPLFVLGDLAAQFRIPKKHELVALMTITILGTYYMYPLINRAVNAEAQYPVLSCDYNQIPNVGYEFGTVTIYAPESGDQSGYDAFPSTPYPARLSLIELRGSDLKDGFRIKEEYRDAFITTYGTISEQNIFSATVWP